MIDPVEQFRKDWASDAEVGHLCAQLYAYLSDRANHLEHFNFSQFRQASGAKDDVKLTKALQYLSSPKWGILAQAFLFFDQDDVYEFDAAEMAQFFEAGKFPHPRTGEVIVDLDEIAVAFELGRFFNSTARQ